MKPLRLLRRYLGWKLLASYLLVVVVGSIVLWVTAQAVAPAVFSRHLAVMMRMMGQPAGMMGDLFTSFLRAMNTALAVAAAAAFLAAVAISIFVTRRIVAPIQAMTRASARIAGGGYGERVPVSSEDELGQLATQFNRMAGALAQTEQIRRDLIADVAHELRTPLASLAGYMEGLLDGVIPAEAETFYRLHREAARLQRLVDDLQELSRTEAGQVPLQAVPLQVRDLVETTAVRFRPQFADKDVALVVDVAPYIPEIMADADRLGQVLTNLIGNALQYTPPGGHVDVRVRLRDGAVKISVSDTGVGIAPEHLARIFERFYRVDRSRARASGGSGIGLTIARHLIEAHGGSIRAESAGPGKGSTFTITLPGRPPSA
ncbi:MAG: HAMP domain-containing protein [Armatimonadetes bacterium]|nr:HAMP domain-containing protein [Armatimonadota bacterium]